jgi:hypothetical protein
MNAPTVRRAADGKLLRGFANLNPGGRPRGVIEEVRERLGPYTAEFCAALVELVRSPNEATRLAAIREAFDRLLGKPPVAVDSTVTKIDMGALYLQALQAANSPIDVTPTPSADEPEADNATSQADDAW